MKILSLSAEAAPFAKTGGLADVCGALPKALKAMGHDVRLAMPAYQNIEQDLHSENKFGLEAVPGGMLVPMAGGALPAGILQTKVPGTEVPAYFVAERNLFDRPKIYGYEDDVYRFSFFSRAVFEMLSVLDWRPDIIHAHDWHAAPALTWLATAGRTNPRIRSLPSLYTIHNLAHQGQALWNIIDQLGLLTQSLEIELSGWVNFMARGIFHATLVNTVSPTYAEEILTPEFGEGLESLLQERSSEVYGILNGIDTALWDPSTDQALKKQFDLDHLSDKLPNKRDLQARVGLPQRDDIPLAAMVTRLYSQKGLDITGHVVHKLLNNHTGGEAQFVVLGTGDSEYETMFARLADYHQVKMAAILKYDGELAQRIYAGADIFLMPSRFEPCGLGQMISMRYGTLPVVRATGGLADTVQDGENGFSFSDYSAPAFWEALDRALQTYYHHPGRWRKMQQAGMRQDFSWRKSAREYQRLYELALSRVRE